MNRRDAMVGGLRYIALLMIVGSVYMLIMSVWREATAPTVDETIASIPAELMPEGWEPVRVALFGGPMLNNGGYDYILVYDDKGLAWEFSRTHRGDDWVRTPIWRDRK